jgi:hypothetical protein
MRCGIELSADEILGEPDDQVVIHGHLCAFTVRPLVPVIGGRGDVPVAGQLLGRVHQQRR